MSLHITQATRMTIRLLRKDTELVTISLSLSLLSLSLSLSLSLCVCVCVCGLFDCFFVHASDFLDWLPFAKEVQRFSFWNRIHNHSKDFNEPKWRITPIWICSTIAFALAYSASLDISTSSAESVKQSNDVWQPIEPSWSCRLAASSPRSQQLGDYN